jgi:methanogenic corrinoid protein MtbC1
MREHGLVKCHKLGRQVYYFLANAEVAARMNYVLSQPWVASDATPNLQDIAVGFAKLAVLGDEQGCAMVIDDLARRRIDARQIHQEVLAAAMHTMGEWYTSGEIGIAEEHMASSITERMLARLMEHVALAPATEGKALLACVEGNHHSLGLRMLADQLRLAGWEPLFLGANVPTATLVETVARYRPNIVLLSLACEETVPAAREAISALLPLREANGFLIGLGGRAVCCCNDMVDKFGADFTATDVNDFCSNVLGSLRDPEA